MPYDVHPDFPNILLVYGEGSLILPSTMDRGAALNRQALRDYLSTNPMGCPVGQDTHDFWIANISSTDSNYHPHAVHHNDPRPFRGIIQMGYTLRNRDLNRAGLISYLWTFLQEIGHYWLIPRNLSVAGQPLTDAVSFFRAFYDGTELPWTAVLARTGDHWSSYLNDMSPMDGVLWREMETINVEGIEPMRRYIPETDPVGINVAYPGEPTPVPGPRFSDLDLTIMGAITREEAYAQRDREFEMVNPVYVTSVPFHAGMVLVFGANDIVYFGFKEDFRTITVERSGGAFQASFSVPSTYDPFFFDRRMLFRIIRRGDDYHFQVRPELGNRGCLASILTPILERLRIRDPFPPAIDPFSGLKTIPSPTSAPTAWEDWNTLAVLNETASPLAVGYSVKTWGNVPPSVDARFIPMQIRDDSGTTRTISTIGDPISGSYAGSLTQTSFTFHRPMRGPRVRRPGDQMSLVVSDIFVNDAGDAITGIGTSNHWTDVDAAPKLLAALPTGDFVAVGAGRVDRLLLSPWAAGAMTGKTLWGFRRRISMRDFVLNPENAPHRTAPANPYKTAFMIVADSRNQITDEMIRNADQLRVACQTLFNNATRNRRQIDTSLT